MMMQGQVNVAFSTSHELHKGPNSGQSNESRQWSNRNRCRKSSSAPFRTKPLALMSVTSKRHWHMQKMQFTSGMCQGYFRMTVTWQSCESSAMAVTVQPQAFQIICRQGSDGLLLNSWDARLPALQHTVQGGLRLPRLSWHVPRWLPCQDAGRSPPAHRIEMSGGKFPPKRWHFQQRHHKRQTFHFQVSWFRKTCCQDAIAKLTCFPFRIVL